MNCLCFYLEISRTCVSICALVSKFCWYSSPHITFVFLFALEIRILVIFRHLFFGGLVTARFRMISIGFNCYKKNHVFVIKVTFFFGGGATKAFFFCFQNKPYLLAIFMIP